MQPPLPPVPPQSASMGVVGVVSGSGALEVIEKRVAKKSIYVCLRGCSAVRLMLLT
jgi:hypothetical protein